MDAPARVVHPLLALALILVAVFGYVAGNHRVSSPSSEAPPSVTRTLSTAGLVLEYPGNWEQAASASPIPGLSLQSPVTVVPQGTKGLGLLVGELPAGSPAPLPASFVAELHGTPHAEVVNLVSTQAFRYSDLSLPGYGGYFDVYAIPSAAGGVRVMACYSSQQLSVASQQCERIVANVAPTGSATATLTPEPIYAKAVSAVVQSLQSERMRARHELSTTTSPSALAGVAEGLDARMTSASASVAALQQPPLVASASTILAAALRHAGAAYGQLADAARGEDLSSYEAARTAVAQAETGVDEALENYTLLGYGT